MTLPDNVETIPEKMFAVVFFEKTAGIINVVTNQQNYADINEVNRVRVLYFNSLKHLLPYS